MNAMHLHAWLPNGSLLGHHEPAVELCRQIYSGLPMPEDGFMTLPDAPGLGFEPHRDAMCELAKLPPSGDSGKE